VSVCVGTCWIVFSVYVCEVRFVCFVCLCSCVVVVFVKCFSSFSSSCLTLFIGDVRRYPWSFSCFDLYCTVGDIAEYYDYSSFG